MRKYTGLKCVLDFSKITICDKITYSSCRGVYRGDGLRPLCVIAKELLCSILKSNFISAIRIYMRKNYKFLPEIILYKSEKDLTSFLL